jgi:ABC-2 type transport system ATP-binding protein
MPAGARRIRRAPAAMTQPVASSAALEAPPAPPDLEALPVDRARREPAVPEAYRADGPPPAISLQGVTRRYGKVTAVDGLSLDVAPGTILGLIGPSGSGKTSTIRMLTGILAPTTGTIRVLGEEPRRFTRRARERIGYMPQGVLLYPELTCSENVDFVASLFGLLFRRRRRRVAEILKVLDLWEVRNRRGSALSGGMQRRLELACALVHDPILMILDEPTVGIDPLLRRSIWQELHRLRDAGRTLLVTTQYVSEAEECDRVALLNEGNLVAFETPEGLRRLALGGDVVEIETDRVVDAASLPDDGGIGSVRQLGPRSFLAVSPDGASATPALLAAIEATGARVVSVRQYRPSFDDVFAMLVQRGSGPTPVGDPRQTDGEPPPPDGEPPPPDGQAAPPDGQAAPPDGQAVQA